MIPHQRVCVCVCVRGKKRHCLLFRPRLFTYDGLVLPLVVVFSPVCAFPTEPACVPPFLYLDDAHRARANFAERV